MLLTIPVYLDSLRTLKDKTLKIQFETKELNPQDLLALMENLNQFGWLAFKKEPFKAEEKEILEGLETGLEERGKTPSQRLRGVLYVKWTQNKECFDTFARYYDHHLEKIITHYKSQLD